MEAPADLPDWVPALIIVEPDLSVPLERAGIRDDLTYQARESELPRRVRSRVASARRDLTLQGLIPIRLVARTSPPWVLDLPVAEMGLPESVLSRLSAVGVVTVGDLAKMDHVTTGPFEERAIRLALYLAGRRGAPARAAVPASPADRVRSAVRSAPLPLRERLLAEIPGVPKRALNARKN